MDGTAAYRHELREAVLSFVCGQSGSQPAPTNALLPKHINLYLFGPQGSGKTSFVRSCYRALYGKARVDSLAQSEISLQRSDDGTSLYSVYSLTNSICLHDTRGQREYTPEEMHQLKLVLEGRARPNVLIQQRRRYWLLLHEFWRSDEQMRRTFSRTVMLQQASLDTEPHFSFMVLDPNQQELLLEDEDFSLCYGSLINDFTDRCVPYALLCTHGDTLTASLRAGLMNLPAKLGCKPVGQPGADGYATEAGPGGVLRPSSSGPRARPMPNASVQAQPPQGSSGQQQAPQSMPDVIRIVTNYVESSPGGKEAKVVERDEEGNDLQQDIHTLLVLLDALRQADSQIMLRIVGKRPAPMLAEAEVGCPLL
eukprot:TRINITY_DN68569_c0_g1_i1.p1 TRINITY_DN68569_c0_g1~~TRINITY_DN68569_c0_g1_i1.p1  ORF type:complete len:367 (-),score=44.19 TRINITY_DN68569_c0_g1_i1:155-1255(-)